MKSIILDRKTGVSQETSANNFDIGSSKIVILNITKNNILSITQNDNQLVVQLKSGNPIIINDFYSSQNGNNENELVIDDPSEEELGYWWIEEPNSGLNWVQLDDLNPLMITNTSDGISPWVYAAGAGILAAGALAGGGGGGGGGHHHKGQQIATPVVSSNNAEGITGTGTPGWEIVLTKPDNTTEVTTVDENGKWSFNQNGNPLAHGETGKIIARDPQNNDKVSKEVETVADCQSPKTPVVETNNSNGISGTAEENSKIIVTNSKGEVVGEAMADDQGKWHIDSPNPLADGETGHFTATDKAGNTSKVTDNIADTVAPKAPIVEQNNAQGISGKAEANSKVIVTNSKGEVVGEAIADENNNWHIEPNPLADGETGHFIAIDVAGNESLQSTKITDTVVPEAPKIIHSNSNEIYGTSEKNALITIKDRKGKVIETTFADEEGNWIINPNPIKTHNTVIRVTATDEAGNESMPGSAMTDLEPPRKPLIDECNADELSGVTEPGSLIYVYDSDGKPIMDGDQPKYAKADPSGIWEFKPNPLGNNSGYIVAMDDAHNVSDPVAIEGTSQYLEDNSSLLRSDAEIDDINNHDDQQSISDKVDSDNTVESDNEPKVINVDNHSSSNESEDLNSNELTSDNSQANDNGDIKDQFDLPNESQYLSLDKLLGTVNSDNGNNLDAIDSFTDRHILLINEDVDLTNLNDLLGSSKEAVSFYPKNNQLQPESDLVEILDYIQGEQMSMVLETNFDNNELNDIQELEKVMTLKDTDDDILTQLANHQAVI